MGQWEYIWYNCFIHLLQTAQDRTLQFSFADIGMAKIYFDATNIPVTPSCVYLYNSRFIASLTYIGTVSSSCWTKTALLFSLIGRS